MYWLCIEVCPHNVFHMKEKKSEIINKDSCIKCGACKSNCPVSAIDVDAETGGFASAFKERVYKDKTNNKNQKRILDNWI